MGYLEGFLLGAFGGFLGEFVGIFKLRREAVAKWPDFLKWWSYWILTIVMIIVGGLVVVGYLVSGPMLNILLAAQVGMTTPLFLERLLGQIPPVTPGTID